MADVIASHPSIARVGLDKIIPNYRKDMSSFYKMLDAKTINTTQDYYRMVQETDLPTPEPISESTGIPLGSFDIINQKDYRWVKLALGYAASTEKVQSDQTGVMKKIGRKLALAFNVGEEIAAHDPWNKAFTTQVAIDGIAWVATTHTLDSGTASNRGVLVSGSYADVALSYEGVMGAASELMMTKAHRGNPSPIAPPYTLRCHPRKAWIAKTLVNSPGRADSSDRASNEANTLIRAVEASPFFSSSDNWFLDAQMDDPGFFKLDFRNMKVEVVHNAKLDQMEHYATVIYAYNVGDWRGVWGTAP